MLLCEAAQQMITDLRHCLQVHRLLCSQQGVHWCGFCGGWWDGGWYPAASWRHQPERRLVRGRGGWSVGGGIVEIKKKKLNLNLKFKFYKFKLHSWICNKYAGVSIYSFQKKKINYQYDILNVLFTQIFLAKPQSLYLLFITPLL